MNIGKNWLRVFAIISLLFFAVFELELSVFIHSHEFNGHVIVHSHPYSHPFSNSTPNHSHTLQELCDLSVIQQFVAVIVTAFSLILLFFRHQKKYIPYSFQEVIRTIPHNRKFRGPPSLY